MLLSRWHRVLNLNVGVRRREQWHGPLRDWPPPDSSVWACMGEHESHSAGASDVPELSSENLGAMAEHARRWATSALANMTAAAQSLERQHMELVIGTLQRWAMQLTPAAPVRRCLVSKEERRFRHSSEQLVQCIRLARYLRGGAAQLAHVVAEALNVGLPGFISKPRIEQLRNDRSLLPSASLMQRYELSLDMALVVCTQRKYLGRSTARFGHADSSPMAGYDWMWSQQIVIRTHQVVPVFKAIVKAQRYLDEIADEIPDADLEDWTHADCGVSDGSSIAAWLGTMREHMLELINPPAALASGHRGLSHKASLLAFSWHLHMDKAARNPRNLESCAAEYYSFTSDLGLVCSKKLHNAAPGRG